MAGLATLILGDAIEEMRELDEGSIGLIVTSPPYNLGKDYGESRDDHDYADYLEWTAKWMYEAYRVLEVGGRLALNIPLDINVKFQDGKKGSSKLPFYSDVCALTAYQAIQWGTSWEYNTTILWLEGNVSKRTAWGSFCKATDPWVNVAAECILVLSKEQRKRERRERTEDIDKDEFIDWTLGMWSFSGENGKRVGHPAPFPPELPKRLIKLFSFCEDTILDPFVGSGTTSVVASKLGRKSIGIDCNAGYIDMAQARVNQAVS